MRPAIPLQFHHCIVPLVLQLAMLRQVRDESAELLLPNHEVVSLSRLGEQAGVDRQRQHDDMRKVIETLCDPLSPSLHHLRVALRTEPEAAVSVSHLEAGSVGVFILIKWIKLHSSYPSD